MAQKSSNKIWILIAIVVVVGGIFAYRYWRAKQSALPAGIVSGNGRIEARLVDATAKEALRVTQVLVDEGDLVRPGQILVRFDTSTMEAELAKNEAAVAAAREEFAAAKTAIAAANADIASANAAIAQKQSEVRLAQSEADRQRRMLAENATSKALFDVRQTAVETSKQTLESAQAQADAAQAQAGSARSRADAAQHQIGVALGQVEWTKSRIRDATLISPVTGRVLYRLVQPGEVLGPGGKALTMVDLSDVYMEIFLPSNLAAALKFGADARITADYEPNAAAAAHVTFVSPQAQFTPKPVETKSEREKLMFRVKIRVPTELVEHYIESIKTGVRGVGYVKVDPSAKWPEWLEKGLLNPERVSEAESPQSLGTSK